MSLRVHLDVLRRTNPLVADSALAMVVAAILIGSAALEGRETFEPDLTATAVGLLMLQAAPLIWRRRVPVGAAALSGLAAGAYGVADFPDPFLYLGPLIGLYTVVTQCQPATVIVLLAVGLAGGTATTAAAGDSDALDYFGALTGVTLAVVLGETQRRRLVTIRAAEARAERLEREHEERTRRAVADERTRIARELHDVVAHHVAVMVVQAEAGAAALSRDPDTTEAAEALDGVAATGRQALTELRRLLGVLREDGERGPVVPQPGVDQIPELVEQVRAAGLPVELYVEGTPRSLPPAVGLSVYRIVQEALTNTLKHAGPARAAVAIRYRDDESVEVEVTDDGRGAETARPNGQDGHGLLGIRERVAVFGGELDARSRAEGGFALTARLPTAV